MLFIFTLGLCIGSFLNVLIYRIPLSLPLTGRSYCPKCKKKINWYDNIPLLSFILLRGKCRHCHSPIALQYPIVELVTGLLFISTYLFYPIPNFQLTSLVTLIYGLLLVSILIAIFVIDLKHMIIPDVLVYPAIIVTFIFLIFFFSPPSSPQPDPQLTTQPYSFLSFINQQSTIINHVITAIFSSLFFLLLYLVTLTRGMGFGDVKLAFLIGLVLGFPKSSLAFAIAFLTGAILGVILILIGKKRFGTHVPFGPFLVLGTITALLWGSQILKWITAQYF